MLIRPFSLNTLKEEIDGVGEAKNLEVISLRDMESKSAAPFEFVLATRTQDFDILLVDAPPVYVSEALEVVSYSDAVILCCREGVDSLERLVEATEVVRCYLKQAVPVQIVMTDAELRQNYMSYVPYQYRYRDEKISALPKVS